MWIRAFLAGLVLFVLAACLPPTQTQSSIHTDINNYRASVGVQQVGWSVNLAKYAQDWANRLAAAHDLVHSDVTNLLNQYSLSGCGEVLLTGPGSMTAQQIVNGWIGSPSHEAILHDGAYTMSGNAVAFSSDGAVWAVAEFCYP